MSEATLPAELARNAALVLHVPLTLPPAAEVREIIRAAAVQVAEQATRWFDDREAAAHCHWSLRTFYRRRDELGIPYSEIFGDLDEAATAKKKTARRVAQKRYLRDDLDAVLAAHMVYPASPLKIEQFPSQVIRDGIARAA